ncbi:MAG: Hsp70 family protein [Ilumatobacteraceae bacterium]
MGYQLGVDLGTTYTAAAVGRDGRAEAVTLGASNPVMPSVVLLRADGEVIVGEVAVRRGLGEPTRVAREFKRRLGDPTPLVLGGTPYGAESLMSHLLREVVRLVTEREGEAPERVVLTHPANYGPYKLDMMREVARLAGLSLDRVSFLTEPEAAAVSYATRNRVEPGQVVAVYDFGGGTFDAAMVRRTADGFSLIGRPEGMERFGGIDIDAAIVAHVDQALDGAISAMNPEDVAVQAGVARLRDDCRAAKEALSADTDTRIAVSLPGLQTEVPLSRSDLEEMVRPRLHETVDALRRAVSSAGLQMSEISRVLLVGGSSRIPLVADTIPRDTGRPVAVDAHPKFAIALGAAVHGQTAISVSAPPTTAVPAPPPHVATPPAAPAPPPPLPGAAPTAPQPVARPVPPPPPATAPLTAARVAAPGAAAAASSPSGPPARSNKKLFAVLGAAVAAVVLIVAGVVIVSGGDSTKGSGTTETVETTDPDTTDSVETIPDTTETTTPETTTPETIDTTDVTFTPAPSIPGDQLRAALITVDEVNAADPGFTITNPGNAGDDLCGVDPTFQPVNRSSSAFARQFGTDPNDGQFLTNELQVYFDNIEADIQFDDSLSIVQNATDCSQTVNGVQVNLQLSAVRAGSDLMATFPGCEEGANILILSTPADTTFAPHETTVWAMRCGNVISTVSVDEPQASADSNLTVSLITAMASASFARVSTLPLQHDA